MAFTVSGSIITQANETPLSITGASSITGGVRFTCANTYVSGNVVRIAGTTNYNGDWIVTQANTTIFEVSESATGTPITFVSSQTGTASRGDASLAGLTGLAGVTTTTLDSTSGFVVYTLADNVKLQINGTLIIGGARETNTFLGANEMLVLGKNAVGSVQPDWRVGSGGVLVVGRRYTNVINYTGTTAPQFTDAVQPQTLIYQKGQYGRAWVDGTATSPDNGSTISSTAFGAVAQGGRLDWLGGTIDCWGGLGFANTSIINIGFPGIRQKPVLDYRRAGQIIFCYSTSLSVYGLVIIGDRGLNVGGIPTGAGNGPSFAVLAAPLVFTNYEPRYMYRAIAGSGSMPASVFTIENYTGAVGTAFDHEKNCTPGQVVEVTYKNCAIGTSLSVLDDADGTSRLYITQDFVANVANPLGVAIQNAQIWTISLASVQSLATTNVSGVATLTNIQTGFADSNTATVTRRFAAGDVATFYARAYESLGATYSVTLRGAGGTTQVFTLLNDASVTLSRTSAGALASIATLDNFYDAAKFWNVQSSNVNYPTATTQVATGAGSILDLGVLNVVIDATTATAFAVNTGTNTVTIKSTTLANGSKFDTLKTTGTISFANGATATCWLQGIVVRGTTGVYSPKLETATMRFTAVGTYDLRNATISGTLTLTNTSGGAVTVQLQPGVTFINNGPNITVDNAVSATFTISNLVSGSRLLIRRTDTSVVLFNEIVTETTLLYTYTYTLNIPVEIVVRKATSPPTYQEWKTTAVLTSINGAVTANQQLDE